MTRKQELLKEKTKLVILLNSQRTHTEAIEARLKEVIDELEVYANHRRLELAKK